MNLIDTHTHLYGAEFDNDIADVIQHAENEGVTAFYLPAIDHEVIDRMLALEARYPGVCKPMMGLHPCSVKADFEKELEIAAAWLIKRPFAAIGETGLDFYWDRTFEREQYVAFERQAEWALQYNLPLVIHSRNSMAESIGVIKGYKTRGLRGIFHCFSGTAADAAEIIDAGFLLGIGGVLTYKNSGLAEAIRDVDLEHLVLETDAPYLAPVPFRGKRNESGYLKYIAAKLAEMKGVSIEEVARVTTANAQKIFGG